MREVVLSCEVGEGPAVASVPLKHLKMPMRAERGNGRFVTNAQGPGRVAVSFLVLPQHLVALLLWQRDWHFSHSFLFCGGAN